ncbi:MAG: hypothetical protein ACRD1Z_10335, partial [Vicinamibacteria bacterium]
MRCRLVLAGLLLPGLAFSRPKTDVVVLENGNRINCEIKKLQRGKLNVSTDAAGTISLKWSLGRRRCPPRSLS